MSYTLHVTRKARWADADGPTITLGEFTALAAGDPELAPDPDNDVEDFLWLAHPGGPWALWWHARGEIMTSSVDAHVLGKLLAIATALDARVLGDDDEQYVAVGAEPLPAR